MKRLSLLSLFIFTVLISSCLELNQRDNASRDKQDTQTIAEISLTIPPPEEFSPQIYQHPRELKFAFIEIEPTNNAQFELSETQIDPLFARVRTIFSEITSGKMLIVPQYTILPKNKVAFEIGDATDENITVIAQEILAEYPTLDADVLFMIIDREHSFFTGANHDKDVQGITPLAYLSGGLQSLSTPSEDLLTNEAYSIIHELLHSYEFGRQEDAYRTPNNLEEVFPFVTIRESDLFGPSGETHPFGPIKVHNGWKSYSIVNATINEPLTFTVENNCLKEAKVVKIPLGYVLSPDNELLAKSIVFELGGKHQCLDRKDPPGLSIYEVFESLTGIPYSYDVPFQIDPTTQDREDPYVFANGYYGNTFGYQEGIYRAPVKEYEDDYFAIELLEENIRDNYLENVTVKFTLKKKEVIDTSTLQQLTTNIVNDKNERFIFSLNTEEQKTPMRHKIHINGEELGTYHFAAQTGYICISANEAEREECWKRISPHRDAAYGVYSLSEAAYASCTLEIAMDNNVYQESVVIPNVLNPACRDRTE